jgi:hypothetical protein
MKQYYDDGYFILPFAHIKCVTCNEGTAHIYVSGDEAFLILCVTPGSL